MCVIYIIYQGRIMLFDLGMLFPTSFSEYFSLPYLIKIGIKVHLWNVFPYKIKFRFVTCKFVRIKHRNSATE